MRTLLCELAAFAIYFLYGSYFEWFFHRYAFHSPKLFYRMFKAHTLVHHQVYKGDDTYTVAEGETPEVVTMDWWAMPAMVIFHLPLFFAVQYFTHIPSAWGGIAAVVVYFTLYESLHYVMHVPATMKKLNKYAWFRFIDNHHHIHHKYMLSNLNVILPLADYTLGTKRDENGKRVVLFPKTSPASKNPLASHTAKTALPTKPVHMVK